MSMKNKKKRKRPKLVIFVRDSRMNVLSGCKSDSSCCFRGDDSDSSSVTAS